MIVILCIYFSIDNNALCVDKIKNSKNTKQRNNYSNLLQNHTIMFIVFPYFGQHMRF